MIEYSVNFYTTSRGEKPVSTFIDSQDEITYAKIMRMLDLIETHGPNLGMPYSKALGKSLFELRIRGKKEVRVFYIFRIGREVILLHAFVKHGQKTLAKELNMARERQKTCK